MGSSKETRQKEQPALCRKPSIHDLSLWNSDPPIDIRTKFVSNFINKILRNYKWWNVTLNKESAMKLEFLLGIGHGCRISLSSMWKELLR